MFSFIDGKSYNPSISQSKKMSRILTFFEKKFKKYRPLDQFFPKVI